jgi:tripartite-type tricarboxylate transporter receptor subunit TctC
MGGELFKRMAGVNLTHVPYRGSPQAITDMLGGQVQVMFDLMSSSIEHIRAGGLSALAVTTATRSEALPDIPTVSENLPGYEAVSWGGIGAPKNTPRQIIDKLNREINTALAEPKIKISLAALGNLPMPMNPDDFAKFIVKETEKWADVIKFAGIKVE